jgi:nicotinate-nucleotide adenylyltransferase
MKVAFFGGTFDPVHRGHLAVARAAADRFGLDRIYFAPADIPPHKQKRRLTDFQHRFAMLALATADDPRFVPSLLDAHTGEPNYSISTVRRLKSTLKKTDKLYFLIGMDAFKDIATWRQPEDLLAECDFIVASRPGFALNHVYRALPQSLQPSAASFSGRKLRSLHGPRGGHGIGRAQKNGHVALPGVMVHLLPDLHERVSSTQIRAAARKSVKQLSRLVPAPVAEYIRKERLYVSQSAAPEKEAGHRGKVLSLNRGAPLNQGAPRGQRS